MKVEDAFNRAIERATASIKACLWPAPYNQDSPEAAYRFLVECCYTFDEETSQTSLIPDLAYIKQAAYAWHWSRQTGTTFIIEKSRRLLYTWLITGLELWSMGLKREARMVAGENYPKAAEFCWRHAWFYGHLPQSWGLPDCTPRGGSYEAYDVPQLILPNGSTVKAVNQQSGTFQGSGTAGIRLEEFSLFDRPRAILSQAEIITGGRHGVVGGHIVIVTNAAPNKEWQECKEVDKVLWSKDPTFKR